VWSKAAQLTSPNSLAPLNPVPAGDQLYGSALNGEFGMYLESDSPDGPVNAVIIALAPGNTSTPARVLAAASSGLVPIDQSAATLQAFNEKVVPFLGTVSQPIRTINVTDQLDFTIYVAQSNPSLLSYIWTPAGATPSAEALAARYA
jgi:hypothetical protein